MLTPHENEIANLREQDTETDTCYVRKDCMAVRWHGDLVASHAIDHELAPVVELTL